MSIMSLPRGLGTISSGRGSSRSILPDGSHSCEDVFGRETGSPGLSALLG